MDKLQPIIKHHFWIVFVLASILPPIAWWLTTGALATEIDERTSSLESTFGGIANGQNAPNDDWANGVNQLISIRTEANRLALDRLWTAQNDLMVWPPNVSKWMDTCPYRGEIEDPRIKQILPDLYKDDYEREVRRVWLIPEPIDDGTTRVDPELKQKVVFPYQSMPRTPAEKWTLLPPTWQEIWNAQEDLWLLSEILGAVRHANDSTSSITDSYVKQIMQVQLFGGKRADAPAAGGSSGGGNQSAFTGGLMPGRPRAGGRGATSLSKPAEFSIGEEYEVPNSGARSIGAGPMTADGGGGGGNSDSDPNSDENRYVQAEEAYRTRGFKLRVAVHQMQVPNLIRSLLNTQYPIEIIRFQQSAMNPEEPGLPTGNRRSTYAGASPLSSPMPFSGAETSLAEAGDPGSAELAGGLDDAFGLGGEAGGDALSGQSYSVPAIANVQASLQDKDLVDLVIIGEIYLYNPPAVDESATGSEAPQDLAGDEPATDGLTNESATASVPDNTVIEGPAGSPQPTEAGTASEPEVARGSEADGTVPASSAPAEDIPSQPENDGVEAPAGTSAEETTPATGGSPPASNSGGANP